MRAVSVPRDEAEEVIARIRRQGLLDSGRRIVESGGEVEVPVTGDVPGLESFEQGEDEAVPREPDLTPEEVLLEVGISRNRFPSSWRRLGDVLLAELGGDSEVAEALLEAYPNCKSVVDFGGIDGQLRRPDAEVLAGDSGTETVHREHGLKYALDPCVVMFSPGNSSERLRMSRVPEAGELVLDMFTCVGQFSIPAAAAGAEVVAVDANPGAARFLRRNGELNGFGERFHPILADSSQSEVDVDFDRILMGHLDSPHHLGTAIEALGNGGWIHYHEACPVEVRDRPVRRVEAAVEAEGLEVSSVDRRKVKSFSPGVAHYVVDCRAE